ncbi:hypothetical protein DPMN_162656 [Dreissena polymorpha]|uniref:Uncharacterized protein n=1 Tax=Dreissena polymorpha TaxID=45954 RepID=A0A9D4EQU9_DREPO|nr:hypothetical protein DPMN_162656 [Dreissena polymorpha]
MDVYNGDINPLEIVEQRRTDTVSKHQYMAKDGTTQTPQTGKIAVHAEFVALRCPKEQFWKLKHCCDTINGILTICDQDLADASTFLNEKLISTITASSVRIYTTEKFEHHFKEVSSANTILMSITDVVEELQNKHEFALIVFECHTLTSVVETLKDAKLLNAGILAVGESDTFQNISGFTLLSTRPDTIVKDADILLEHCALALLKIMHSKLKLYESEQTFAEQKRMCFLDIDDLIKTVFRNIAIPRSDRLETQMPTIEYPSNIDEAIEKLVYLPAVNGCLKKRGTLQIYVSKSTNESDQKQIRRVLEKHGIAMMVSEVQPQQGGGVRYTAQILDDGLSLINDCQFVLFEENDE